MVLLTGTHVLCRLLLEEHRRNCSQFFTVFREELQLPNTKQHISHEIRYLNDSNYANTALHCTLLLNKLHIIKVKWITIRNL